MVVCVGACLSNMTLCFEFFSLRASHAKSRKPFGIRQGKHAWHERGTSHLT